MLSLLPSLHVTRCLWILGRFQAAKLVSIHVSNLNACSLLLLASCLDSLPKVNLYWSGHSTTLLFFLHFQGEKVNNRSSFWSYLSGISYHLIFVPFTLNFDPFLCLPWSVSDWWMAPSLSNQYWNALSRLLWIHSPSRLAVAHLKSGCLPLQNPQMSHFARMLISESFLFHLGSHSQ